MTEQIGVALRYISVEFCQEGDEDVFTFRWERETEREHEWVQGGGISRDKAPGSCAEWPGHSAIAVRLRRFWWTCFSWQLQGFKYLLVLVLICYLWVFTSVFCRAWDRLTWICYVSLKLFGLQESWKTISCLSPYSQTAQSHIYYHLHNLKYICKVFLI